MSLFVLVDCNNFYASCERVFNPDLEDKPIVILSNNDGCVIARSNEAKALHIPMGAPFFQYQTLFKEKNVKVFSGNFELYGDMSARVMATLASFSYQFEIYSIDEAFLQFESEGSSVYEEALKIRKTVKRWTGLPVSIGIAPTKTLAKIANNIAKNETQTGVLDLQDASIRETILERFPVNDIWGIGRKLGNRLMALNILTAKDLREADPQTFRKMFSVVMEKIIYELRGKACLGLQEMQPKKQMMSSRSFGKPISHIDHLQEAVGYHVSKVAEKLRKQKNKASGLCVCLYTNRFKMPKQPYLHSKSYRFLEPTHDTGLMIQGAMVSLKTLFQAGLIYNKLGILLFDLTPDTFYQYDLFLEDKLAHTVKKDRLMETIDGINTKMGRGTLKFCVEGFKHEWAARSHFRSSRYTTCIEEIHKVQCK